MKQETLKIELSEKELEGIVGGGRASNFVMGFKEPFTGGHCNNGYRGNFRFFEAGNRWANLGIGTAQALTVTGIAAVAIGMYHAVPFVYKKGKELLGL